MTSLAQACQDLAGWLAIAETLAAIPDVAPSARPAGKPGTRLPGNVAALCAVMDAHAGVRAMEDGWRLQVTGTAQARGGSDANTLAALESIPVLAGAVPEEHQDRYDPKGKRLPCRCPHCEAGKTLTRWALIIQQLPAIDTAPRWIPIRPGPDGLPPKCPWCETFSLRLCVEFGRVQCWFPGCEDDDGRRPSAQLEISRLSGQPVLAWGTGYVQ